MVFENGGDVDLQSLEVLPSEVVFKNGRDVELRSVKVLGSGVVFGNRGFVNLQSAESLPPGVVFNNREKVYLNSLLGVSFNRWKGNIQGVDSKRLLNLMIKKGLFER